ncbi:CDP-alcohol phosphatidyltransferase family protein [Natranaerobius thermophilus]|uniref:CDP-alcohol phosphatidyltransferase n=1 Tax=Natranaerobius thermophilus (strain ATCC BAA-1301 / DSM 18059 / JW/NM-WN-LF) TaxID=457570 RepID=B2A622_NATTJ|nr:CDP-alcohol phosphatidyltransferase family protein [Natranaerobius thermophilus]ACB85439.1 CDP-alcohol phosphatidyltransferase [Natranaerobius thermophilus JW/NM-WN-LF]
MQHVERWLPTIFTFANLTLGFLAMTFIYSEHFRLSLTLLILALFFDGIDGRLSRKFNVSSIVGKELDSLSDYLSFGVAPSLFYLLIQGNVTLLHYVFIIFFLLCGAYQIAKYNTDFIYGSAENVLLGLPINAAGILLVIMGYLDWFPFTIEALIILIVSPLMVTQIPYPSFKAHHPKKHGHFLFPIIIMVLFIIFPATAFVVFSIYVVYGFAALFIDFDNIKKFINIT